MRIVVSPRAAADLVRLRAFLAERNPAAAERAAALLVRAVQSLESFPDRGYPSPPSRSRHLIVPFGRSAYVLRYRHSATKQTIVIQRVWHGREARD